MRWPCAAVWVLAGCATDLSEVAERTYRQHERPAANCRVAVQVLAVDGETYHEVSACDRQIVYRCYRGTSRADPSTCAVTDLCTSPGCDSYEAGARIAFGKDNSCPYERLAVRPAAEADALAPPPDVASDPGRLAMWTHYHPPPTTTSALFTVDGCGATGHYACEGASGHRRTPTCALTAPLRPAPRDVVCPSQP